MLFCAAIMSTSNSAGVPQISGPMPDIQSIGISVWDPIYAQRDHTGPNWELVHIVRGVVTLHLEGRKFRGKAGDTLLVPANMMHRDEFPPGSEFEVLHIMFRWDDAAGLFSGDINSTLVSLPRVDKQAIRELAFATYDCFRARRMMWEPMTRACLFRLLLFMRSAAGEQLAPKSSDETAAAQARRKVMIQDAKEFIQNNLNKPVMLSDIATHLGVSAYHLSHIFSEESGFTLSSYLGNSRMEKAAAFLGDPAKRVADVAYAVGFEDPNYFCKVFRRHFGCSPGSYQARKMRSRTDKRRR